ncbi:UDP-glycosyltransferase 203D1-like protein, partial [Dinothrombium tinctorium]
AAEKSQKLFAIEANKWLEAENIPPLPKHRYRFISTNLNVYIYPKPLIKDYLRLFKPGKEWFGLDHSIRESKQTFHLPPNFKRENEKLIFSRWARLDQHKIIVVTGKFHDQYELADNMWGDSFLPQLEILPLVDLVITHGGNNTFIETLYFGKPMIVMPLFADQHDNARRVVETKIARTFNPFTVDENELLNAIDTTLNDSEMAERIQKISKHIRESNTLDVLVRKVEEIAKNPKFPTIKLLSQ